MENYESLIMELLQGDSPKSKYEYLKSLKEASVKLWALEGAGVDNWEGYEIAMESLEENQN
jgi:hypothetical protein